MATILATMTMFINLLYILAPDITFVLEAAKRSQCISLPLTIHQCKYNILTTCAETCSTKSPNFQIDMDKCSFGRILQSSAHAIWFDVSWHSEAPSWFEIIPFGGTLFCMRHCQGRKSGSVNLITFPMIFQRPLYQIVCLWYIFRHKKHYPHMHLYIQQSLCHLHK